MGTRVISFYEQFQCLATKCPNTCCRGWRISIDNETRERYEKEEGAEGFRLKATMTFGEDKEVRRFFGRCANETKEGLCRLQLKGREELMPEICRIYPRRSIRIGDDEEVTFELSCPMTARLFLENMSDIRMVDYEGDEIVPLWIQHKFNEKHYDDILAIRDKVIDYINSDAGISQLMSNLYYYYRKLHSHVMAQDIDIKTVPIMGHVPDKEEYKYTFYSFAIIDRIIMNDLKDGRFSFQDALYDFSKSYNKIFGKMTAAQADDFFNDKCEEIINKYPKLHDKYKAYLAYYTYQMLYSSYEYVTFYKEYLLGNVYLMLIMTSDVVDFVNGKDMDDIERQIKNLNNIEKRLRHNLSIKKNISHRLEEEFIKIKEGYKF